MDQSGIYFEKINIVAVRGIAIGAKYSWRLFQLVGPKCCNRHTGAALCHSGLSSHLGHSHPISGCQRASAISASKLASYYCNWEATGDGPCTRVPAIDMRVVSGVAGSWLPPSPAPAV